jgi:hypothetical protein
MELDSAGGAAAFSPMQRDGRLTRGARAPAVRSSLASVLELTPDALAPKAREAADGKDVRIGGVPR